MCVISRWRNYGKGHDPESYAVYLNARMLKDLGPRHRPDDGGQGDQPPAPPQK